MMDKTSTEGACSCSLVNKKHKTNHRKCRACILWNTLPPVHCVAITQLDHRENPPLPGIPKDELQRGKRWQLEYYLPLSPFSHSALTSYLIFCFLFPVTVEPSWWAVGCCQDYEFEPEELQPERHRAKVSVIGWEGERHPHAASKPHTAGATHGKNVTHNTRTKPRFDLDTHRSNFSSLRHCQSLLCPAAFSPLTRQRSEGWTCTHIVTGLGRGN